VCDPPLPDLPREVFGIVARQLRRAGLYNTLASLNVASKAICYETTPEQFHTVFAQWGEDLDPSVDLDELDDAIAIRYCSTYQHIRRV
jgi:hypothetical protein